MVETRRFASEPLRPGRYRSSERRIIGVAPQFHLDWRFDLLGPG